MSQKVSEALIKMLNEETGMETAISKIDAAIFVKTNEKIIKEKISYLQNLVQTEANNYNQKVDKYFEYIEKIVNNYNEKLLKVYDELYLQYVNIQNELGDARLNKKATIINYQKIINDGEIKRVENKRLKSKIKAKNEIYNKIINLCYEKIEACKFSFKELVDSNFSITNNLSIINDNSIFERIKNKLRNVFYGNKKFEDVLKEYEASIENIKVEPIIENLRNQTVEFVTDILELKDAYLDEAV